MPSTERRSRRIDVKLPNTGGGGIVSDTGAVGTGPAIPAPGAPTGVRLGTPVLLFSAVTPAAGVAVFWQAPAGLRPESYLIQWSTSPAFTAPSGRTAGGEQTSGGLDGLPIATTIYVRVAAVARGVQGPWSNTASALTPSDTSPPAAPSGQAAVFIGAGDLEVTWTNPTSANFRDVRITVYSDATKTTTWEQAFDATGRWRWTAQQNRNRTSGSPDPAVYVELESRSWGGIFSAAVNASATKARPATPGSVTATWDGATGVCNFSWAVVPDAVRYTLTIDGVARSVATAGYSYPLALNRQEHSGTADPVLTWSLTAIDGLDQTSTTPASGTATLAPPATPTGFVQSWASDPGTASADWLATWNSQSGIVGFRLVLDGTTRDTGLTTRYSLPYEQNGQEHGGTPEANLTYDLRAIDALGQVSATPVGGNAINAVPPAVSISVVGGASTIAFNLGTTTARDFDVYRIRIYRDAALIDTIYSRDQFPLYQASTSGTYQADVTVYDLFAQGSAVTTSAAVVLDFLTIADLRADAIYSDILATSPATLKTALADDNRASGGITYTALASWRWIRFERPLLERYRTITVAISGTVGWYLRSSADGTTWRYWAAPVTSSRILTEVASEAAARAAPVSSATLGNATAARVDLASIVEARYFELGFFNATTSYRIDEFYPRRLVQSDDIEAEAIKAINISAAAITADKIAAGAITAGKIAAGAIDAMLITGASIRTAASGQRVELDVNGFRTYNSANQVQVEATTATDGELRGGQGLFRVNRTSVLWQNGSNRTQKDRGYNFEGTVGGAVNTMWGGTRGYLTSGAPPNYRIVEVVSESDADSLGTRVILQTGNLGVGAAVFVQTETGASSGRVTISAANLEVGTSGTGNLIVGSSGILRVGLNTALTAVGGGGWLTVGDTGRNFLPTTGDVASGKTTLLLNADTFSSIGFHDSGTGFHFIVGGNGEIVLGYDGGSGNASILHPGLSAFGGPIVSQQRVRIYSTGATSSDIPFAVVSTNGLTNHFYIRGDGQVWSNQALTISDRRMKRQIAALDPQASLATLRQLQPSSYRLHSEADDGGPLHYGLIAQDAQAADPQLTRQGEGDMLGIDYTAVLALLIAGFQALDARQSALERRIAPYH